MTARGGDAAVERTAPGKLLLAGEYAVLHGAEAVVVLNPDLTDGYSVERGEDSLTLRFGAGLSITFQGLVGAGAIGVSRPDRGNVTLLHQPPGLDRAL